MVSISAQSLKNHVIGRRPGGTPPIAFVVRALIVVGLCFRIAGHRIRQPELIRVEQMFVDHALGTLRFGYAGKKRHEVCGRLHVNALTGLLIAIEVHALLLIPESKIHDFAQLVGMAVEFFAVCIAFQVRGDHRHGA